MSKRKKNESLTPSKRVEKFLECVKELEARPFIIKELHDLKFRIEFQKETGKIICEFKEGDQEYFRSFLMTFRKFLMDREPANIDSILNICIEHVKPEQTELKEVLKEFKTIWGYQYREGTIRITSGNHNLTPEYVLNLWFNGQYFHSGDTEKSKKLEHLLSSSLPSVKLQLLWSLPILTDTITRVGALLTKACKEYAFKFSEE